MKDPRQLTPGESRICTRAVEILAEAAASHLGAVQTWTRAFDHLATAPFPASGAQIQVRIEVWTIGMQAPPRPGEPR